MFQFESEQNTDFDHDYKIIIILPFAKETWPQIIWKIIILYYIWKIICISA